ncbi:cathepsin W-like isoform X1 [Ranitomeya variabilis]|uniref:cathepsin W-like isoform X1 n=1 Tax=Ranitomeya variabilis TaxID=490064 RepID=UPI004057A39E
MYFLFSLLAPLCVFIHAVLGKAELKEFEKFIKRYNKAYKSPEEYRYRLSVFTANLKDARRLQKEERGTAKYGVTKFSDLTDEEFTRNTLTYVDALPSNNVKQLKVEAAPVHESCDWRKAGVISKAKNQSICGSCWAFTAVGNIEAQWGILGHPVNLSVQQVLDCGPCEAGCRGAYIWDAYITVMKLQGLVNERDYEYVGVTQKCRSTTSSKTFIYDFLMLPKNEHAMANYLKNNGTIAVAINNSLLKDYVGGVIEQKSCEPYAVNHAVLLVGYHLKDKKQPHWILKNSWGEDWGENGFFKLHFGSNMCGVTTWPLSAVVTYPGSRSYTCPP